ncbi:hypothetical protein AB0D59_12540 [Streptomyces sp. NPDC048417]|uniref:hypothetical protein n=1 Tax=Streptomyces sp. NPDC048417 TaxID=3155387 RepID=UPI003448DD3E
MLVVDLPDERLDGLELCRRIQASYQAVWWAAEHRMLTELALYVGGCTVEVAEALGADAEPGGREPLTLLTRLVDKSLLVPVTTPRGSRLRMLEMVREYALVRLRERGAEAEAEQRFMSWADGFVRECSEGLASGEQRKRARQLAEELPNLRAASDLMTAHAGTAQLLRLEARLGYHWLISGREEEGIDRLRRALKAYDAAAGVPALEPTEEDEWALFTTVAWLTRLLRAAGRHAEAASYRERQK